METDQRQDCPYGCGASVTPRGMSRHKARCANKPAPPQGDEVAKRVREKVREHRDALRDLFLKNNPDDADYKDIRLHFQQLDTCLELLEGKG